MENQEQLIPITIEDEVKESYLNYAMSVIVSRALPDVRDGLKPVHRRILFSMNEMGLRNDRPYKKCGRIVGDVLGKYHPHGDQSIYDALVRLAQDFSLRIPVVQGQGNFGSIDGDPPAAMRYTEARLSKISESLLRDINKETVDFKTNYDDTMEEPSVLPTALPYLLVNGSNGIAVGMATNMAPHNLAEICEAICRIIDNPDLTILELLKYVQGPDFPTAGIIHGKKGIVDAATTGKGKIVVRARYEIEEQKNGKEFILITEIPYLVNKSNLIVKIADLIKDKKVEGIADLRDESSRKGMRIVIEVKKGFSSDVILNVLFAHTQLQANFNVNNLCLVNGKPKLCNLKDLIKAFIQHRQEVIRRRSLFDLKKAKERAHILEGLKIALDNIDEVIQIIKNSSSVSTAKEKLMKTFSLSERQAHAILEMRLQKLTALETKKIMEELEEVKKTIEYLEDLLAHEHKILAIIGEETRELSKTYGTERKTEIEPGEISEMDMEDFIERENMTVLISDRGFIKRLSPMVYREQRRGGKGANTTLLKDGDYLKHIFVGSTHSYILFITNAGKAYWLKTYQIPEGSKGSRGKHLKSIFDFEEDEEITTTVTLDEFTKDKAILMATEKGMVKQVSVHDFRNAKMRGIRAINLEEGDKLISAILTEEKDEVMLFTAKGKALRTSRENIRIMGRTAQGVRGIRLKEEKDKLIGAVRVNKDEKMLLISENGSGRRTEYDEFSAHGRGTQGQTAYKVSEKTGDLIGAISVVDEDSLICITAQAKVVKVRANTVSVMGRNSSGVKIVNTTDRDKIIGIAVSREED